MDVVDWTVVAVYLTGIVAFALWHGRRGESAEGYFLAGRSVPGWIAGTSLYAQGTSAVSLVGMPAFVALQPKGGLQLLQFQVLSPLVAVVRMLWIIPPLYRSGVFTVYEFFDRRFGIRVRWLHAATFLASRAIGTAIQIHATLVVLQVVTGQSGFILAVFVVGASLLYASLSGLRGDIYSDVVQVAVFLVGTVISVWLALGRVGPGNVLANVAADRVTIFDFSAHGFGDGVTFASWPLLLGGFLVSLSLESSDQTSVQRQLATASVKQTQHAVLYQAALTLVFIILELGFGLVLAALLVRDPAMKATMAEAASYNELVPRFLLAHVPHGVLGVLVAAMFAATMSSVDSALNALSVTTMRDFVGPLRLAPDKPQSYLRACRLITMLWGLLCGVLALFVGRVAATIIVAFRKLGALFWGPMFATFFAAVQLPAIAARGMFVGILAGVASNLLFWRLPTFALPNISFYWWTVFSFLITLVVARLASGANAKRVVVEQCAAPAWTSESQADPRWYAVLLALACAIFVALWFGQSALRRAAAG